MCRFLQHIAAVLVISFFSGNAFTQSTVLGNPGQDERSRAICADAAGGTYIGGTVNNDAFITKRNSQSEIIWSKRINFPDAADEPIINCIKISGDTIFGCGYFSDLSIKQGSFYFKLNATTGSVYWIRSIMKEGNYLTDMSYSNNRFMLVGGERIVSNQLYGKVISVSSADGEIIWQSLAMKFHNANQMNSSWTTFTHATEIVDGRMFIISSTLETINPGGTNVSIIRPAVVGINENGIIFMRKFINFETNGPNYKRIQGLDIQFDGTDSLVLTMCHVDNYNNSTFDFTVLMKCDLQLNGGFTKSYTVAGPYYISPATLTVTADSYVVHGAADEPLFVLKTSKEGVYEKCITYSNPNAVYENVITDLINAETDGMGSCDYKNGLHYFAHTQFSNQPFNTDVSTVVVDENLEFAQDCSEITPVTVTTHNLNRETGDCLVTENGDYSSYSIFFNFTDYPLTGNCENLSNSFTQNITCAGTIITPVPNGLADHSFQWSDGSTGATNTVLTNDTLIVRMTDSKCCFIVDTIVPTVSQNTLFVSLPEDTVLCAGALAVMFTIVPNVQANPNTVTYNWNDGSTDPQLDVNISGTYWVDVTGSCGTVRDSINVTYTSLPVITGEQSIEACSIDFPVQYSPDLVTNSNTMSWENGVATAGRTIDSTGTYTLTATNICGSTSFTVSVTAQSLPEVQLISSVDTCLQANQSLTLNPVYANTDQVSWSTTETTNSISVTNSGNYTVTASNECGTASASALVTINYFPELNMPFAIDTCFEIGEGFYYTAQGTPGNYSWSSGSQTATELITDIGIYDVTLSNSCGSVTASVIVNRSANLSLTVSADSVLSCEGNFSLGNLTIETNYEYEILNDKMIVQQEQINTSGWYYIRAFNKCGEVFDSVYVNLRENQFFYLPNAFTPNQDIYNEYYNWKGENIFIREFRIFNRWGEEVFNGSDPLGWNGKFNNLPCPDGIYTVHIVIENCMGIAEEKAGFVTLLR